MQLDRLLLLPLLLALLRCAPVDLVEPGPPLEASGDEGIGTGDVLPRHPGPCSDALHPGVPPSLTVAAPDPRAPPGLVLQIATDRGTPSRLPADLMLVDASGHDARGTSLEFELPACGGIALPVPLPPRPDGLYRAWLCLHHGAWRPTECLSTHLRIVGARAEPVSADEWLIHARARSP